MTQRARVRSTHRGSAMNRNAVPSAAAPVRPGCQRSVAIALGILTTASMLVGMPGIPVLSPRPAVADPAGLGRICYGVPVTGVLRKSTSTNAIQFKLAVVKDTTLRMDGTVDLPPTADPVFRIDPWAGTWFAEPGDPNEDEYQPDLPLGPKTRSITKTEE